MKKLFLNSRFSLALLALTLSGSFGLSGIESCLREKFLSGSIHFCNKTKPDLLVLTCDPITYGHCGESPEYDPDWGEYLNNTYQSITKPDFEEFKEEILKNEEQLINSGFTLYRIKGMVDKDLKNIDFANETETSRGALFRILQATTQSELWKTNQIIENFLIYTYNQSNSNTRNQEAILKGIVNAFKSDKADDFDLALPQTLLRMSQPSCSLGEFLLDVIQEMVNVLSSEEQTSILTQNDYLVRLLTNLLQMENEHAIKAVTSNHSILNANYCTSEASHCLNELNKTSDIWLTQPALFHAIISFVHTNIDNYELVNFNNRKSAISVFLKKKQLTEKKNQER
ncbi:hypothetical protein KAT92_04415 [Candidatus Babeliales bacterium]|nr:hypothetical protein [Candidatus Babeliales bacterium]